MEKNLSSVDVNFFVNDIARGGVSFTVKASLNEALTLLSMPCLSGLIVSLVPTYELSEMPEKEG